MTSRTCATCGAPLAPDAPRHHILCRICWVQAYNGHTPGPRPRTSSTMPVTKRQAVVALGLDRTMFRRLVSLTHPDRHGQSDTANAVTAWLNTAIRPALDDPQ